MSSPRSRQTYYLHLLRRTAGQAAPAVTRRLVPARILATHPQLAPESIAIDPQALALWASGLPPDWPRTQESVTARSRTRWGRASFKKGLR